MNKFIYVVLNTIIFFSGDLFAAIKPLPCKRQIPCSFTTAVIIPCHEKHTVYLYELLKCYSEQSLLPDEIIISVSGVENIDISLIESIESESWPFNLIILKHVGRKSAGANRNSASEHSSSEILICQDSDDIPHPQRVEVIKFFFDNYDVHHLLHRIQISREFIFYNDFNLIPHSITSFYSTNPLATGFGNGICSLLKKVWQDVRWGEGFEIGEDIDFNRRVYEKFSNNMMVGESLYLYKPDLSSFSQN